MKKNYFTKALSAILVLMMVLSVMTFLPLTASAAAMSADLVNDGDLLYKFDFSGKDGVFKPDYISSGATKHTYTVTADGSGFNVKSDGTGGSGKNMWGGVVEGFELSATGVYTMIYKVRSNSTYAQDATSAKNNSLGIGAWVYDLEGTGYYNNYSNYNAKLGDDVSVRRAALSKSNTKIEDYAMFNDTNNPIVPLNDADGFMTTMLVYDGPSAKMTIYVLVSGDGSKDTDWKKVQESSKELMDTTKPAQLGFIIYTCYNVVDSDVKDVCIYKGEYLQKTPTFTIANADDLMGLQAKIDALDNAIDKVRVVLTADIDMTGKAFTPINTVKSVTTGEGEAAVTTTYPKAVIFSGNNHTIKNLTIGSELARAENAGLFSKVGANSSFVGIRFENIAVYGKTAAAALVADAVYGDMNFANIIVDGKIDADGNAGSLLGKISTNAKDKEAKWTVRYCVNKADIMATRCSGGLFGKPKGAISFTMEYCANYGDITVKNEVTSGQDNCAGGMIGCLQHGSMQPAIWAHQSFKYCVNKGDLTVTNTTAKLYISMGGLAGDIRMWAEDKGKPYGNTFEAIGIFDYSARSNVAYTYAQGLTGMVANNETPEKFYTDCYGMVKDGSAYKYTALFSGGNNIAKNCAIVTALDQTIVMSTGKTTFGEMIESIETAINTLSEVVLPTGSFNDGKDRDYTWFYKDGALVEKGTEAAPFEIANAAQWAAFSALSNGTQDSTAVGGLKEAVDFNGKYFKLTGDIDLTGYTVDPIGGNFPTIVFDGNGKTISNAALSAGDTALFTTLGRGSAVKNLSLKNVDITGLGNSAFIAAKANANVSFYNIKIDADSSLTTVGAYGAGLVAFVTESATATEDEGLKLDVKFCVNEASITASDRASGMVAQITGSVNVNFNYCVNKGALTITGNPGWACIGGMVASLTRGMVDTINYFSNCYNTGKITIQSTTSSYCFTGGIVGDYRAAMTEGSECYFTNCLDYSSRENALEGKATYAIKGNSDNAQLYKEWLACYGCNTADTVNGYSALTGQVNNSDFDSNSMIVFEGIEQAIVNQWGLQSTMKAEMEAIDNAIATLTEMVKPACEHEYDNACDADCNKCGEERVPEEHVYDNACDADCNVCGDERTPEEHVYDNDQDATCNVCGDEREISGDGQDDGQGGTQGGTTDNNDGDNKTEEKKGCGGSVNALYAVIALVAIVGCAFVAKKREEN